VTVRSGVEVKATEDSMWYSGRWIAASVIFMALVSLAVSVLGGECGEGEDHYLTDIEIHGSQAHDESFHCLQWRVDDWNKWAGPIAASMFEECRRSPIRERLTVACTPLLADTARVILEWQVPRYRAAVLLASYGISRVADQDIFGIITKEMRAHRLLDTTDYMALAALRDSRTVQFLAERYDSVATLRVTDREDEIRDILNCLYHVPGDSAVALAKTISERERDPAIKERAERVIHR
jgi:hypothetical protein